MNDLKRSPQVPEAWKGGAQLLSLAHSGVRTKGGAPLFTPSSSSPPCRGALPLLGDVGTPGRSPVPIVTPAPVARLCLE